MRRQKAGAGDLESVAAPNPSYGAFHKESKSDHGSWIQTGVVDSNVIGKKGAAEEHSELHKPASRLTSLLSFHSLLTTKPSAFQLMAFPS